MKRGPWSRRTLPCSALLQSMSKTMINKAHELLHAQDVWHPCSPQDNEARTCFLKNSWSLSRGFLILEGKTFAFGYSECLSFSLNVFLSPWLTSTVQENASNKTEFFSWQNSTGGTAMVGCRVPSSG